MTICYPIINDYSEIIIQSACYYISGEFALFKKSRRLISKQTKTVSLLKIAFQARTVFGSFEKCTTGDFKNPWRKTGTENRMLWYKNW